MNKTGAITLSKIIPNPEQPRQTFDETNLQALADSIVENGLVQPVTVEETEDPEIYILIDGERRWRAHQLAGLETIDAVIKPSRNGADIKAKRLTEALVANLQREDMNPIDEAKAYEKLKIDQGWSYRRIATKLGTHPVRVGNRLALLTLDEPIQDLIASGKLSKDIRVVKALRAIPDREARIKLAKNMAYKGLSISLLELSSRKLVEKLKLENGEKIDNPSVHYAQVRTGPIAIPIYQQLEKENNIPPWDIIKLAAKTTCRACAFFDQPSESVCNHCPAVSLISDIISNTREEKL